MEVLLADAESVPVPEIVDQLPLPKLGVIAESVADTAQTV
jgi:hypothetical protein